MKVYVKNGESGMIWENSNETCITICKADDIESSMHEAGHSKPVFWGNPVGWDGEGGGKGVQNGGTYVHIWLIHVAVWQKSPHIVK